MSLNFEFASPVEELNLPILKEKKIRLSIKRDDMIHPFISGNKWRKLKYVLQSARERQLNQIVTFGGAWSNHLLATASAGSKFGFKTTAFVRGDEVSNPILALCKLNGMELKFVSREDYKNKNELFQHHFNSKEACFIDEGGFSKDAAKGCAEIIQEINPTDYHHLFTACGTGATIAGLAKGLQDTSSNNIQLHGVPVLKGGDFIHNSVTELEIESHNIQLHLDYHFGGYAKTKPALLDFIKDFVSSTGILIEPTYTGKVLYAVFNLIESNYFAEGEHILILHTGGLTGILGYYDKF